MMSVLLVLDRIIRAAVVGALGVASLLLLVMAVAGATDVVMINAFGQSLPIVSEMSADALAVVIFLAIAFALSQQQHVSVDLVTNLLSPSIRRALSLAVKLVTLVFFAALTWRTWVLALESWELRQSAMALIAYPVYPFKIAALAGTVLALLESARQLALHFVHRSETVAPIGGVGT